MSQTDDILARLLENNGAHQVPSFGVGPPRDSLLPSNPFGNSTPTHQQHQVQNQGNGSSSGSSGKRGRALLEPPEGNGENARRVKGIRRIPPPIDLDAPTQPRTYITPSSTSRKTTTAAVERQLERYYQSNGSSGKHKDKDGEDVPVDGEDDDSSPYSNPGGSSFAANGGMGGTVSDLPPSLLSTIELKRRQNTLAARRSRARKAQHLKDLENEVIKLEKERDDWKDRAERLEDEVRRLGGAVSMVAD